MVAARGENWSVALKMPHVAIKNRAFFSIFRVLTSYASLVNAASAASAVSNSAITVRCVILF